ncbi:MAG TPA: MFS transporter [Pirellulales bacterium]|jgi:MFS family permease|nr:MFS transporter [Pirellulales bacterium]
MSLQTDLPAAQTGTERPWYAEVTPYQWLVLLIASLGWIFDTFEGQIFPASEHVALLDLAPASSEGARAFQAHVILAAFLCGGSLGGIVFGMLSDRIGRSKTMIYTILMYSLFTFISAAATNWQQLAVTRFLVAMGVGGEWAVASALVAEVFPPRARARSLGIFHGSSVLGGLMGVGAGMLIPQFGWRVVYVAGALPALLTIWVRYSIREPESWHEARSKSNRDSNQQLGRIRDLFAPGIIRNTLVGLGLATVGLATYWGVFMYGKQLMRTAAEQQVLATIPADASAAEKDEVLSAAKDEAQYADMRGFLLQTIGAGIGLLSFGPICERIGRRAAFLFFHLGSLASALILFLGLAHSGATAIGSFLPVFGFFIVGMHAGYAVYFPELFPTRMRGTGAGFCFNCGRLLAAPILIIKGVMQSHDFSLEQSASTLSVLFLLGCVLLIWAKETKDQPLPE